MERSKANKKKFQMRSPFKGSITEFMAMGKALGSSKIKPSTAVDPSKYYTAPKKQEKKEEESAVDKNKREKAEIEMADRLAADKAKATQPTGERKSVNKTDLTKALYVDNSKKSGEWGTNINYGEDLLSAFPMKYGRKK